jgi:protocatechuate 3,4-dioxygenase beta subunit
MLRVLAACAAVVVAAVPTQAATATASTHGHPLASISGIVVDADGHPLQNAAVEGFPAHVGPQLGQMRTGPDGRFRLPVPAAGSYVLATTGRRATGGTSDATGYAERDRAVTVGQHGTHGLRITLAAGAALRGTVTDLAGHPLAGVGMAAPLPSPYLEPNAGNFGGFAYYSEPSTRTNARGHYVIRGLDSSARIPCANPQHASGGNADATGYAQQCAPNAVALDPQQIATVPTLALQPRVDGAVTGTITGPNGTPVRNAFVSISPLGAGYFGFASTDATGHFTKVDVPVGKADVCEYGTTEPGLGLRSKCRTITVTAGGATPASLRLARGGAISGRLRTRSGAPVVGAPVVVTRPNKKFASAATGYTDSLGDYTVGGLNSGSYRVCFPTDQTPAGPGATGAAPTCLAPKFAVTAGRDHVGVNDALGIGAAVAGMVTDSSGRPLHGVTVSFRRADARGSVGSGNTTAAGTYLAKNLPPGTYTPCALDSNFISASRHVCLTHTITVHRGQTAHGVDLSFPAVTRIQATVTDPNGHPLSGVEVAAVRKCDPNGLCAAERVFGQQDVSTAGVGMTDDTGAVDLPQVRPGKYAVCALAYYAASQLGTPKTGYADQCTGSTFTVTVTRGSTTPVSLQLAPGGTLTGRVTTMNGRSVRGATIHVTGSAYDNVDHESFYSYYGLDALPSPFTDQLTNARGYYSIHSVHPGQSPVCARDVNGYRGGCSASHATITGAAVTHVPRIRLHPRKGASFVAQPRRVQPPVVIVDGHRLVLPRHL